MNTESTSFQGVTELTHWALMSAKGPDAAAFLHSQLSTDFKQLSQTQARLAGYCNPKGRLLATFLGWRTAPDEFVLACHRSVLASTLQRLSMFVMRAQCRLSDGPAQPGTDPVRIWGLAGDAAGQLLSGIPVPVWGHHRHPEGSIIRLPDVAHTQRVMWVSALPPDAPVLPTEHWRWLEVQSAIPMIEQSTAELFVPQMINFELVGGIDFKKGCYPGQEVVARSQYRGTLKRRLLLFDVNALAHPGHEVFDPQDPGQAAGVVVAAAPRPQGGGCAVLVSVKLAAVDRGLILGASVDGPILVPVPMPYPVSLQHDVNP